ncbi:MAG: hypothetical protein K9G36_00260 [Crocinitomicaceae bacterium]|jgi:hypothetical protein|nr:hypothetical protein [Crocinitomicaceae bacterium]MCF8444529.1 hypothetical protein [Crocinitomicaceae bacterium]
MDWTAISSVFFVATVKFLFSPFAGIPQGLSFLATYLSAVSGATLSSLFFYFSAEFVMNQSKKSRLKKEAELLKNGKTISKKKIFTRGNKLTIRLRNSLGKFGICFIAPSLLSIPLGTIIVAKFYGKEKDTFLWVFIGILLSGLITTSLAYFVFT